MYRPEDYPKNDRKAVLKDVRFATEYPVAYLAARRGGALADIKLDENARVKLPDGWDFIETDYH
jgi:hypothetical protein